jgi:hypothetical protein
LFFFIIRSNKRDSLVLKGPFGHQRMADKARAFL